jgi:hypothetical protein
VQFHYMAPIEDGDNGGRGTVSFSPNGNSRIVATYDYVDERGEMLYQVIRFEPKDFRQRRPDGAGEWLWNLDGVRRVLYRLPLLATNPERAVFVVEGEKDVDNLAHLGIIATTNPGGAGKWRPEYSDFLRGRHVIILPDNDGPGLSHAKAVAASLNEIAASIKILELPGLPPKGDVSDWLAAGGTRDRLLELALRGDVWECDSLLADGAPVSELGNVHWPESLADDAFHGLAGEIARTIKPHTEADSAAILAQFLVAFGNAVGRSAYYSVGPRRHHTNLYCVMVGRTSKGRKGTAWSWVEELFPERICPGWLSQRVETGLSSGEGLITAVRDEVIKRGPVNERRHVTGRQEIVCIEGVNDKRLLIVEEEFSSVLRMASRDGNILSAVIRQAWDSGKLHTMTKNNPTRATGAHVSIIGHVSKEELIKCLSRTETANGFANRFLWICVRRSKLLPEGEGSLDLSGLQQKVGEALLHAATIGPMNRNEEARTLWHQQYATLSAERPGPLGLVTNRSEAHVLRISCLYALLDHSPTIRVGHLRAALALWQYCERSCRWIFGESTGNSDADELLDALRVAGPAGLSLTETSAIFGRHKPARLIRKALGLLADLGLVLPGAAASGGKRAKRWIAVPEGYETANPAKGANPLV